MVIVTNLRLCNFLLQTSDIQILHRPKAGSTRAQPFAMSQEPLMPCLAPTLRAHVTHTLGKLAERHTRWFAETEDFPVPADEVAWEGDMQPLEEPELLREAFQSGDISGAVLKIDATIHV